MTDQRQFIRDFMAARRVGVLATVAQKHPHQSLMAFAVTADLSRIVLATPRSTRKYGNLQQRQAVSLLVDDRTNTPKDLAEAVAVTAYGVCSPICTEDREQLLSLYLDKHPFMDDFATSPGCVLLVVDVERYEVIERFQNVTMVYPEGCE